jgi:stage II sporulation protein GA (sporulation sigma-E factor processing peptidase)
VNFFILRLTCLICKEQCRFGRIILASFIGSAFSLYIFLPPTGFFTETVFKLIVSALIVLLAFRFTGFKAFLRKVGVFFAASFLYAGAMMGIWAIFGSNRLTINNGIVYLNISPTILIISTLTSYALLSIIRFFSAKQAFSGKRCEIIITYKNKMIKITALVDTGHSLTDLLTNKDVIIIEKNSALHLTDKIPSAVTVGGGDVPSGFRLIPYSVIGGHGLLPAFTPDKVELISNNKIREIPGVLIGISDEPLGDDYKGIISPTTLAE